MKIVFIKPNMGLVNGAPYYDRGRMEPLTFAVLAGITPRQHETVLYDDRFECLPFEEHMDLVAINTEIYTARRAYEIADRFRTRGVPVVLGGFHTTMIPEESLDHADAVVLGDAEPVWETLLQDLEKGRLKRRYVGSYGTMGARSQPSGIRTDQATGIRTEQLTAIRTDWSVFLRKKYLPVRLTQFSRGCINQCEYCATGNIYRQSHRCRPVEEVVRELEQDGARFVFFVDDNLIANKAQATLLFKRLKPLRIRWFGQADLSFAADPAFMELMLESGCSGLVVGFESLDPSNLVQMQKNCNLGFETYDPMVEAIRRSGLMLWAAFLLGYDNETPESVKATCDWALSKKFAFSAFNILMPYPGTPLYARMEAEGRLLYDGKWWLHDDYRFGMPGFRPRNCSPDELAQACLDARRRHSSVSSIFRRALDPKTHLKDGWSFATYLSYNPLFRDEMLKKHGMVLGYRGIERSHSVELLGGGARPVGNPVVEIARKAADLAFGRRP
jgi:radical SAM superfamily enzyme YgiQ (UPF0313 family)